jgi:hypothetical protein
MSISKMINGCTKWADVGKSDKARDDSLMTDFVLTPSPCQGRIVGPPSASLDSTLDWRPSPAACAG